MKIAVVGSINVDLVARCRRLPQPGETVTGATFTSSPGGKGANQAVAAARLGAEAILIGAVADDELATHALVQAEEAGVDLSRVRRLSKLDVQTGVALVAVAEDGENQIVVAPGANGHLAARDVEVADADAVVCQLEIPDDPVRKAAADAQFFCLNAAPYRPFDVVPDLLVVNEHEHEALGHWEGLTALTLGARGAVLLENGREVARARPPSVRAVDSTGAGDAFTSCLIVSLLEGRRREEALRRACAAGALAASRAGAQPSLPTAAEVDRVLAA